MEGSTSYLDLLPPELKYQISRIIEGQPFEFQNLPDYLRKHVAIFVRYNDLMGLCEVSDEVREEICGDNFFWKAKLKEDFGRRYPDDIPEESSDWRSEYENFREIVSKDMWEAVVDTRFAGGRGEEYRKRLSKAKEFLDTGAVDPNYRTQYGSSITDLALIAGASDIFLGLLELGGDPTKEDELSNVIGDTMLLLASEIGCVECVRELLNRGFDPNLQGYKGTVLMMASRKGNPEIVQLLLEAGVDPNVQNSAGYTALIVASKEGNPLIVRLLLEGGADIDATTVPTAYNEGVTALFWASDKGHIEVVQELLRNGADPYKQDPWRTTSLDIAQENGHPEIVNLLRMPSLTALTKRTLRREGKEIPSYL